MITEDYVSFEIAKLLKEKGFDVPCNCYGAYNGINLTYRLCITDKYTNWNKHTDKFIISCPTLQMAMKWLRNTFHLEIYSFHDAIQENNDWWYKIEKHSKGCSLTEHESDAIYKTYEEACEAAIKYCLKNLI